MDVGLAVEREVVVQLVAFFLLTVLDLNIVRRNVGDKTGTHGLVGCNSSKVRHQLLFERLSIRAVGVHTLNQGRFRFLNR